MTVKSKLFLRYYPDNQSIQKRATRIMRRLETMPKEEQLKERNYLGEEKTQATIKLTADILLNIKEILKTVLFQRCRTSTKGQKEE